MATFRQEQIDEILNYERSLNRKIYDTEILAVSRMNDERNPPSNRDIKFEAILGGLIDKLKQTIAEAVQSIASKQYPSLNAVNSAKLLALKSGVKGILAAPPNFEQAEQNRLAAEATRKAIEDSRKASQSMAARSGTSAEGPSLSLAVDEDGIPDVEGIDGEDDVDADEAYWAQYNEVGDGSGRPIRARHQGFGADFINRKKRKVGGVDGPTAQQSETAKSEANMTKTTENLLYNVVGQYNGIIDKLLEATQQNGLYKNKRLASASNVQYYANVLKGLMEPLKHLLFELSQVQQPETASLFQMVAKMVDIIDISPPFQKIDVSAYREGKPDFQGLNDDVVMNDYSGYLKALEKSKNDYLKTIRAFDNEALRQKATLGKVDQKYKSDIFKEVATKQKIAEEVMKKLQAEIMNVKKKMSSPLFSIQDNLNDQILSEVEQSSQMLKETIGSNASEYGWVLFGRPDLTPEEIERTRRLPKEEQLAKADILAKKVAQQQENVRKMVKIALEQGGLEDDVTGAHRRAYEEAADRLQKQLADFEQINNLDAYRSERAAVVAKKLAREQARLQAMKKQEEEGEGEGEEEGEGEGDAEGALAVERGEGPAADASKEAPAEEGEEEEEGDEEEEGEGDEEEVDEEEAERQDKMEQAFDAEEERLSKLSAKKLREECSKYGINITKKGGEYHPVDVLREKLLQAFKDEYAKREDEEEDDEEDDEEAPPEDDGEGEWTTVGPKGKPIKKSGKGKPLADLLARPRQQFNSLGRPLSNDDKINNEMIKANKKFQMNNPRHENPVGSLNPFKAKTPEARYDFPTELRYERNITNPTKDARGADYSLLQGEIGGPTVNKEVKRQYRKSERQVVTPAQALQNVLNGAGKKSGALKKLVFDDEANDMFDEQPSVGNRGFIPEDKEDHFKFPDLKKKKEKEAAAKLLGRKK